ncbi:MAG TPA: proton-conducting transporter membrane subunit, partial [Gemmatimonadaceae bacterium]|nr:proton-conducting transporter membrane subunit [Gemmatimonadaceae bacterium]
MMPTDLSWILPALLALPLVGAAIIWLVHRPAAARWTAWVTLVAEFALSLALWFRFDPHDIGWQFAYSAPWIQNWGIRFSVGLDGIGLVLVLLTTFLMPLVILGSWTSIRDKAPSFYALLLVLTTGMLGVFVALDLFLFYIMWEVMLVPMYFIIGIWGGERRIYASIKFFIYTMFGSL